MKSFFSILLLGFACCFAVGCESAPPPETEEVIEDDLDAQDEMMEDLDATTE